MAASDTHTKIQGSHDKEMITAWWIETKSNVTYNKYLLKEFLGYEDRIYSALETTCFNSLLLMFHYNTSHITKAQLEGAEY